MKSCQIIKNQLLVGDKTIAFEYGIRKVEAVSGLFIVLLDIPFTETYLNNVYAIDNDASIVWRIQDSSVVYPVKNKLPYEHFYIDDNGDVIVSNFYGVSYIINVFNGEIKGKTMTK